MMYVAEDGKKFSTESECLLHEDTVNQKRLVNKIKDLRIRGLDECVPPFPNVSSNHHFRWYVVHNKEEMDAIDLTYGELLEPNITTYPSVVCVESDGVEPHFGDCNLYSLTRVKSYNRHFAALIAQYEEELLQKKA